MKSQKNKTGGEVSIRVGKVSPKILLRIEVILREMLPATFPKSEITVHLLGDRVQVVKRHPGCHSSSCPLSPKDLNNEYHKYVHSAVVKKLKPYFVTDHGPDSERPDYTCGYKNLPDELLIELLDQLALYESHQPERPAWVYDSGDD